MLHKARFELSTLDTTKRLKIECETPGLRVPEGLAFNHGPFFTNLKK
jgi:hypothetical protein